jgi:hypothetical protein
MEGHQIDLRESVGSEEAAVDASASHHTQSPSSSSPSSTSPPTPNPTDESTASSDNESFNLLQSPADLFMVSPPPRTANAGSSTLRTPLRSRTSLTPPPPNSENVLTAIRQAEQTLNAAILDVNNVMATPLSPTKYHQLMEEEESMTPESGCASPMVFSPSLMKMSFTPPRPADNNATTATAASTQLTASTPMNKSLFPVLTTLEEEQSSLHTDGKDELEGGKDATKSDPSGFDLGEKEDADVFPLNEINIHCETDEGFTCNDGDSLQFDSSPIVDHPEVQAKPYRRRILDDESSTDCNGNGSGEMELAEEDDASQSDKSEGSGASSIDEALSRLKMNDNCVASEAATSLVENSYANKPYEESFMLAMPPKFNQRRIVDADESASSDESYGVYDSDVSCFSVSDDVETKHYKGLEEGLSGLAINEISEDDDDVLCFDGCGCWTVDEKTGDLYLPPDTESTKWPRIRLPLPLYQKLFQHQRIGVQWMASLHRNKIKGGILAVSEELV